MISIYRKNHIRLHQTILLILTLFVASCQDSRDIVIPQPGQENSFLISASLEQHNTSDESRLSIAKQSNEYSVLWSENETVTVLGTGSSVFTIASGAGTQKAVFSGDISSAGEPPYFAALPCSGNPSLENGNICISVPQTSAGVAGNISMDNLPAVAKVLLSANGANIDMRHVFGLLRISISGTGTPVLIRKMTLHDLGGNMLWGTCRIPVSGNEPDFENISLSDGDNTISMIYDDPVEINSSSNDFFFPVPPGAMDKGFSVVLYEYDPAQPDGIGKAWTFLQKISSPVAAQRASVVAVTSDGVAEKSEPLDLKARGYYKTLFVDAGAYLSSYYTPSQLPFITAMGIENDYEYYACNSDDAGADKSKDIFASSSDDDNGVLLYPDGEPRFRVMYVNGGTSYNHGPTLGDQGRENVHTFFVNGGSYTGTCAGSLIASTYVDGTQRYGNSTNSENWSFGIWPGDIKHTGLPPNINTYPTVFTGMKLLPALKEKGYYDFAVRDTIEDTRHHGGSYLPHTVRNKAIPHEELMTYQYSDHSSVPDTSRYTLYNTQTRNKFRKNGSPVRIVDSVSFWAYKPEDRSGRMVVTGSHPERQASGSQLNYMMTMERYALDGNGSPEIKGTLALGTTMTMNKRTADGDPSHTGIGDRQYHHFKFESSEDIKNFTLALDSEYDASSGINLYLALRRNGFAWLSDAEYVLCNKGGRKTLSIRNLPAGTWYISVYCATTVSAEATSSMPRYFIYSGKTQVLNGVAYSLTADVDPDDNEITPYKINTLLNDFDD